MRIFNYLCAIFALLCAQVAVACVSEAELIVGNAPVSMVIDADTGQILHQSNPHRRFIPASVAKVMSAYVAFEMIEAGKLKQSQSFRFSENAAKDWRRTGSTMFLEPGDTVLVDDLLRGITSVSANDASVVLAEGAAGSLDNWVALMNSTARELGMRDSHFGTPNGWPDSGRSFTTAHDLGKLARALIRRHPQLYARYFGKEGMRYNGYAQANHDPISGIVEGADGIKTGFTNQAGNNFLGSARRGNTRLIIVVAGIDEETTRARISRDLIEWGFRAFDRRQIFKAGDSVGIAGVQNGTAQSVKLVAPADITIAIDKDTGPRSYSYAIRYQGPLEAPVLTNTQVAKLVVRQGDHMVGEFPLFASQEVEKASFFGRIANAFRAWFS